jgi:hypothetical protein
VIEATQKLTGCAIERGYVDKGYRGHDVANARRVFISGQKRGASAHYSEASPSRQHSNQLVNGRI